MRHRPLACTVLGTLLLFPGSGCARAERPEPIRVLMLVGGIYHDYEKLPVELAARLTERGDGVTVDITTDLTRLNKADLESYQVLLFNVCQHDAPTEAQRDAIMSFVRGGKGLVSMHCALWSYQDWPEWAEMVGGFAPGHDKYGEFPVTILDPADATMEGLGSGFSITDEPYTVDKRDPDVNLLIRTTGVHKDRQGNIRSGPEPQVWRRPWGDGRVFVVTFGHDGPSQRSDAFITLMHNGVRWASGRLPPTRHNVLTKSERQEGWRLLFDGASLDGWSGDVGHWSVRDGELVGRAENLPHNMFLVHDGEFGDFTLRCQARITAGNSGIQFRSRTFPDHVVRGYQADVAAEGYGNLYEEGDNLLPERRTRGRVVDSWKEKGSIIAIPDGWNDMIVTADGPHITIRVNGLLCADYVEPKPEAQAARGVIALQLHVGPLCEVRFRDLRIRPLR